MATTLREYLDKSGVLSVWTQMKNWVKGYAKIVFNNGIPTITIGNNSVTPLTEHQDISGKADKSEMAVSASGDKTTITLKSGTSATVLNAHQDISGKQDVIDSTHKLSADLIQDGTNNKAFTADEKTKLGGIAAGAEVNQNTFSNVKVGSITIAADTKTDTLEIAGGGDVVVTPDATNDKVTISVTTPKKTSDLTNDSGFITIADVPEGAAPSSTAPKMDAAEAVVGTETAFARGDHQHPRDTTKANVGELAITPGTGANADKTNIQLKNGLSATVLTAHQDISGKADKVSGATAGNVATLDANGNIVDSGKSADSIGTDTKNTAGSTNDASKLFLVGAKSQAANAQTFSQTNAYATGGKLFSNAKEVVNLSDEQALTNKTYNGFTLAAACAKAVDTSIPEGSTSTNLPTSKAVADAIAAAKVGAAMFQDTVDAAADISGLTNYKKGYYWVVATAGEYAGETCEVGDMIFCVSDYSSAYKASDFSVVQSNLNVSRIDETWITANCV